MTDGKPRRAKRAIDQALCDRIKRLAEVHALKDVAEIVGLQPSQISRIKRRGFVAVNLGCRLKPRPPDFEIQAAAMNYGELIAHYGVSTATLTRWMKETPGRKHRRADKLVKVNASLTAEERRERSAAIWAKRRERYGPTGLRPRELDKEELARRSEASKKGWRTRKAGRRGKEAMDKREAWKARFE